MQEPKDFPSMTAQEIWDIQASLSKWQCKLFHHKWSMIYITLINQEGKKLETLARFCSRCGFTITLPRDMNNRDIALRTVYKEFVGTV